MPDVIRCPSCARYLHFPAELAGRLVQCPACRHSFTNGPAAPIEPAAREPLEEAPLSRAAAEGAPLRLALDDEPALPRPRGVPPPPRPLRPVPLDAPPRLRPAPPLPHELQPHRGPLILTLAIVSILCGGFCGVVGLPCGLAAWVMGHTDLRKMDAGFMDPGGRAVTRAGYTCAILGTLLDILNVILVLHLMR